MLPVSSTLPYEQQDLVYKLRTRAAIRRQISTRKSVQEGAPDRLANLLDEAANEIEKYRKAMGDADTSVASGIVNSSDMRARCDALLLAMVGPALAPRWWQSPNKSFEDNTPDSIFMTDPQKVYQYLITHAEGQG